MPACAGGWPRSGGDGKPQRQTKTLFCFAKTSFFAFPATAARCSQFATAGEGRYLFPAAALLNDSLRVPDVMSG